MLVEGMVARFHIRSVTEKEYLHYEIANYAKAGYESKHNLLYWQYKPYYGFGPAAASFVNRVRKQNVADLDEWANGFPKEVDEDSKKEEVKMAEFAFLALRLLQHGLVKEEFSREFGVSVKEVYGQILSRFLSYGWLLDLGDRYILSEDAVYFANQIFMEFLPN